jgi:hypothetical protein
MDEYEPLRFPDPRTWLSLDESERIALVRKFHEHSDDLLAPDALELHSSLHVVVENQIAMEIEPVPATISRLIQEGLDRHEAIHAVGAVISSAIWDLSRQQDTTWDQNLYRRKLERLTAKRWRKGKW